MFDYCNGFSYCHKQYFYTAHFAANYVTFLHYLTNYPARKESIDKHDKFAVLQNGTGRVKCSHFAYSSM